MAAAKQNRMSSKLTARAPICAKVGDPSEPHDDESSGGGEKDSDTEGKKAKPHLTSNPRNCTWDMRRT